MPQYLVQVAYTPESWAKMVKNPQSRLEAVRPAVESLGGKGRFRKDKIAEQVFYQGPSTNNNKYDFPTLASIDTFNAEQLQKPPGADFWEWIKNGKMPV